MVGAFISNCFNFVNYTWILKLPTEFFYLCGLFWFNILGGTGVFCLGYYGYGASISTEETRTRVLGKSKNTADSAKRYLFSDIIVLSFVVGADF